MSRGWFILELYTAEGVAQTTDVNIELSDHIRIDVNNADHCDASIEALTCVHFLMSAPTV